MSCFEETKLTQLKDLSFVSYSYSVSSGHIQKYPRKLGLYTIYGWSFEFTVLLLARLFVFTAKVQYFLSMLQVFLYCEWV